MISVDHWLELAIDEARRVVTDVPVGSIVVLNERVIGIGRNQREESNDPTGHAEIIALRQAAKTMSSWRLNGAVLYSTLEPCPMCAEAIIQARVAKLVFGAYDPKSGAAGSAFNLFCEGRIYPIPEVIGGIKELECRQILIDYFAQHGTR